MTSTEIANDPTGLLPEIENILVLQGLMLSDLNTVEDLGRARLQVQSDIDKITGQLGEADDRRQETGEPTDRQWLRRAQHAMRQKKRVLTVLDMKSSRLNRAARETRNAAIVSAVREAVPLSDFERYVEIARERHPAAFSVPA